MSALADLERGWTLPADAAGPIEWTDHAVEQFGERLRPGLEAAEVRRQLSHMLSSARVTREAPDWFRPAQRDRCDAYLLLGTDVCMPLRREPNGELVALTALNAQNMSPSTRENRNTARANRRAGKQGGRRAQKLTRGPSGVADLMLRTGLSEA